MIAPLFSRRARERRAALKIGRAQNPGATVELVLGYPLSPDPSPGEFHSPSLLVANHAGVGVWSLAGSSEFSAPWAEIESLATQPGPPSLMTIMVRGTTHQWYGVHGSGTFALSPAQLRRMVARVERKRPA